MSRIDSAACALYRANEARSRFSKVTTRLDPILEVEEEEEQADTVTSEIGFRPSTAQNFVSTCCQDFSRQPYDACG